MVRRPSLSLLLVLAAAVCGASGASAQDRPGECVTRRVTGPGGAYRWDRVECAAQAGWSDFDRWGYDRRPLDVVDGPLRGDRYGGWSPAAPAPVRPGYPGRDERPFQDDRPRDDLSGAPYPTYRVAGRDADGFLVWPGKLP
jgi:hypothetical protein